MTINKAILFAQEKHKGQTRKGSTTPYILHCLEAGTIAASLSDNGTSVDENLVASAILHDTIEDAGVSYEELLKEFNEDIANLVKFQSEDKSKSWIERKQHTINSLMNEKTTIREKKALLADKLSNMRAISRDYVSLGEELWNKFNAGKEKQEWYYRSIGEHTSELKNSEEHKEYLNLVNKTFK